MPIRNTGPLTQIEINPNKSDFDTIDNEIKYLNNLDNELLWAQKAAELVARQYRPTGDAVVGRKTIDPVALLNNIYNMTYGPSSSMIYDIVNSLQNAKVKIANLQAEKDALQYRLDTLPAPTVSAPVFTSPPEMQVQNPPNDQVPVRTIPDPSIPDPDANIPTGSSGIEQTTTTTTTVNKIPESSSSGSMIVVGLAALAALGGAAWWYANSKRIKVFGMEENPLYSDKLNNPSMYVHRRK